MLNQLMRYVPLAALVEKEPCEIILEVGSGIRGITRYLTEKTVVGVDVDFTGLEGMRNEKFYPVKAEAKALPFKDGSFEIVVCSDTLEHIPHEDREKVIRELWRVASKKVYLAFPTKEGHEVWEKRLIRTYGFFRKITPWWLKDHIKNGLPKEAVVLDFFRKNEISFRAIRNENNFIHYMVMIMDGFIFPQERITDVIAPSVWKRSEHSLRDNVLRLMFGGFRGLLPVLNFGSTVRKIFILNKNSKG